MKRQFVLVTGALSIASMLALSGCHPVLVAMYEALKNSVDVTTTQKQMQLWVDAGNHYTPLEQVGKDWTKKKLVVDISGAYAYMSKGSYPGSFIFWGLEYQYIAKGRGGKPMVEKRVCQFEVAMTPTQAKNPYISPVPLFQLIVEEKKTNIPKTGDLEGLLDNKKISGLPFVNVKDSTIGCKEVKFSASYLENLLMPNWVQEMDQKLHTQALKQKYEPLVGYAALFGGDSVTLLAKKNPNAK